MVWQVALNRGIFSCSIKTLQQQCSRRNIHVTKLVSTLQTFPLSNIHFIILKIDNHKCSRSTVYSGFTKMPLPQVIYNSIRDHPFKTSANFHHFWPLPSSTGSFFTTIRQQFWTIFDPSPLKNADISLGWSLRKICITYHWHFQYLPRLVNVGKERPLEHEG